MENVIELEQLRRNRVFNLMYELELKKQKNFKEMSAEHLRILNKWYNKKLSNEYITNFIKNELAS